MIKKHTPMPKMAIALQYFDGDREAAQELIELIRDLEQEKNHEVMFITIGRKDAESIDEDLVKSLSKKFPNNVQWICSRSETGHPAGCNAMWFDLMNQVYLAKRSAGPAWSNIECVLTFEADSVPLSRYWLRSLYQEWQQHKPEALIVGHYMGPPASQPHINGNCLVDADFARIKHGLIGCPTTQNWDLWMWPMVKKQAAPSGLIWSDYRSVNATTQWLFAPRKHGDTHPLANAGPFQPVFLHGVKDSSARIGVRRALLETNAVQANVPTGIPANAQPIGGMA